MKICWDNLEKLRLNSRGNLVNKNNAVFIEMEFCINCGEPYLMSRVDPTKFCSIQCSNEQNTIDLTGKRFGRLTVLHKSPTRKKSVLIDWVCRCSCGKELTVTGTYLRRGVTTSCGCYRNDFLHGKSNIVVGDVFGELCVIKNHDYFNHKSRWLCRCSCGNTVVVLGRDLIKGHTRSCGCYKSKTTSERCKARLIDRKFGRLLVIEELLERRNGHVYWKCLCDCGNYSEVSSGDLNSGKCVSCGCYRFDINWKGGISAEPYCPIWLDEDYKKSIKERDNYKCQNPYCWGTHSKLFLHHINYNKQECGPQNLITLCCSCNSRANINRDYWQNLYEGIMRNRGLLNDRSSSHN